LPIIRVKPGRVTKKRKVERKAHSAAFLQARLDFEKLASFEERISWINKSNETRSNQGFVDNYSYASDVASFSP
jgi:hypothetical protein